MNLHQAKLIISDVVCLSITFLVVYFLRITDIASRSIGKLDNHWVEYMLLLVILIIVLTVTQYFFGLYQHHDIVFSPRIIRIVQALLFWSLSVIFVIFYFKMNLSRIIILATLVITSISIITTRYIGYIKQTRRIRASNNTRVLMIKSGRYDKSLYEQLVTTICAPGVYDHDAEIHRNDLNAPICHLFAVSNTTPIERIIGMVINRDLQQCCFHFINKNGGQDDNISINDIDSATIIQPQRYACTDQNMFKRILDIALSSIIILVSTPAVVVVTMLIILSSREMPILRQRRIGLNGKPFTMYKFRTMRSDTPLYEMAPSNGNDPRITRIGRILRRFSLDELPQLWNVLKGDMSIVGPRPEMEFIVKNYKPWQRYRLRVKPGLTGLWQIIGRKDLPLHENLEYDFFYVATRNFVTDISIILKTIPAVIFGKGAY